MKHKHTLTVLLLVVCLAILSLVLVRFHRRQLQLEEQVQIHEYNWKHFDVYKVVFKVLERKRFQINILATGEDGTKQLFPIYKGEEDDQKVVVIGIKDLAGEQYIASRAEETGGTIMFTRTPACLRDYLTEDISPDQYRNVRKLFDGHTLEFTGFGEFPVYSIGERRFGFAVTER